VVEPQGGKELSQMILRPLSRNISGHPRDLNILLGKVRIYWAQLKALNIIYEGRII